MPRQMPTTLRLRLSRSNPRRKPPPSRSKSAAAVPDINAPSRTVRPPFRLFDPFSAGLGTRLWLGYPLGLSASALKAKLFGGYPSVSTQRLSRLPFVPPSPRCSIPSTFSPFQAQAHRGRRIHPPQAESKPSRGISLSATSLYTSYSPPKAKSDNFATSHLRTACRRRRVLAAGRSGPPALGEVPEPTGSDR